MKVRYSPDFFQKYKKADVRIRNKVDEKIAVFLKDPYDLQLDNHTLKRQWKGLRSIDVTSDWRAIYKETQIGDKIVAYFVALGTHKELYGKS
jgi:addiction module RelE/StbE family toxin